ncbi:hypothetical protein Tco_0347155 [Tanacetum coccineum]
MVLNSSKYWDMAYWPQMIRRATYQRLVDKVLNDQTGIKLEAYVDDMVIKSASEEDMLMDNKETFDRLRSINMKLNMKMCSFGAEEGPFLGHLITNSNQRRSIGNVPRGFDKKYKCCSTRKKRKEQVPIYFVRRVLQGGELNYPKLEKLILALVHAARRLRRQILAYFLAKTPSTEYKDTKTKKPEEANKAPNLKSTWKLYIDGASSSDGSGASLMLVSPEGKEYTYA